MGRPVNSNLNALLALPSCNTQTTLDIVPVSGPPIYAATDKFTTNSHDYLPNLIRGDQLQQSVGVATNRVRVEVDNVDKSFGSVVVDEDLVKAEAILGRFHRNELTVESSPNTGEWRELFRGLVIPIEINESIAILEIVADLTAAGFCVANWSLAENCQSPFKMPGLCGYTGGLTTCNKRRRSPDGCLGRDNELRFMGMEYPDLQVPAAPSGIGGDPGDDDGGGWPGDDDPCFVGRTRVNTPLGNVSFSEMYARKNEFIGSLIYSFDDDGGFKVDRITAIMRHVVRSHLQLKFGDHAPMGVTPEHPFWQHESKSFVAAGHLKIGDRVWQSIGGIWCPKTITDISRIDAPDGIEVFNLTAKRYQHYFVEGIGVHNRKIFIPY